MKANSIERWCIFLVESNEKDWVWPNGFNSSICERMNIFYKLRLTPKKVPGQNAPWCLPLHTLFQAIYPHTPECWGQLHWTDCTLTWETDRKWNNLIWEGPNDNCAHLRGRLSIVVQSPCQVWHQPSSQLCSSLWFCARSPAKPDQSISQFETEWKDELGSKFTYFCWLVKSLLSLV